MVKILLLLLGGDGTINEVMNGLVGKKAALGILPAGTGNVFAADLGIPTPNPLLPNVLLKAADCLLTGQKRQIDVAKATFQGGKTRYFLLWAGVGIDSAITHAFEESKARHPARKMLGAMAWLVAGFSVVWKFRGVRTKVTLDDEVVERRLILTTVNNSQLYGRLWRLAPNAKIDDGLLDVVIMEGYGFLSSLKHVSLATIGQHVKNSRVHIYHAKHIKIEPLEPHPLHLDAEDVGFTPVEIEIVPQALNCLIPQNAPSYHFA